MNSAYGDDDTKPNRLGVGAHYWTAVDNIDDDNFDEDGVSWLASYQYWPGLFGIEAAVEWLRDGFGGSEDDVFLPQAYLIFGKWIYAAAGIGGYYTDGRMADDPFYALRAGLNLELLPYLFLDLNANYRFEEWDDLREEGTEIDTDTVTLGGAVRIGF
ncbi:MAG TPA: hypothetical protein DCZ95_14285 [Verrucomicrobia bacterium]|nr:hypothetical protein [Verrucomicrobiota bacterium]